MEKWNITTKFMKLYTEMQGLITLNQSSGISLLIQVNRVLIQVIRVLIQVLQEFNHPETVQCQSYMNRL